jgi:hypothetical protein
MNDLFVSPDEIKNELKEIESLGIYLNQKVMSISHQIGYIISKIKACETIELAADYFNLLDEIQGALAVLVFEQEIMVPDLLRTFVSNFDNLAWNKEYLFQEIKNGTYNWRKERDDVE